MVALKLIRVLVVLLSGIALLIAQPAVHAAGKHGGHGKGPQSSLLPACQDASALPSPHCGRTPTPVFDRQGHLWVAFSQHGHIYVAVSDDQGKTFSAPRVVNPVPEAIYDDGENRPKIAIGPYGELFVSWTHKTPGRYSGDIRFARSPGDNAGFEAPITINNDRALISHRFDSMQVDVNGNITLVWIDKRDLAASKKADKPYAGAALYYARSNNRGKSFQPDRKLVDHSCECCRIALDMDDDNRVVALWRHVYPDNIRDHAIARIDEGLISGMPVRATDDDWFIEGCPHHGPDLAIDDQQQAHIVWFSQGKKHQGLTYGRFNLDTGKMESSQAIDVTASASRPQVLWLDGELIRGWKYFDGKNTRLLVSRSHDRGESWSADEMVAQTEHASDHPQLLAHNKQAFISWHTQAEGYQLIPLSGTVVQ